jgi:hypothetical protein
MLACTTLDECKRGRIVLRVTLTQLRGSLSTVCSMTHKERLKNPPYKLTSLGMRDRSCLFHNPTSKGLCIVITLRILRGTNASVHTFAEQYLLFRSWLIDVVGATQPCGMKPFYKTIQNSTSALHHILKPTRNLAFATLSIPPPLPHFSCPFMQSAPGTSRNNRS